MRGGIFKVFKESGIGLSGSIAGVALNYVLLMVLVRFLEPRQLGAFVIVQSVAGVVLVVALLGMPSALDRFIPEYRAQGMEGRVKSLVYRALTFSLGASAIAGALLALAATPLACGVFGKPELAGLLRVVALSIPFLAVIRIVCYAFTGHKELRYEVYIQHLAFPLLKIGAAVAVLGWGLGLAGWIWGYVVAVIGAAAVALGFFARRLVPSFSSAATEHVSIRNLLVYSWPLSLAAIAIMLRGQIDVLFLGVLRPSADVASYRIFVSIVALLSLVLASFARVYKPVVCEMISLKREDGVQEIYQRVAKWIFMINGFAFISILLFGEGIVGALFTERYVMGIGALAILAAGRLANSAFGPEGMTLEAYGNTRLFLLNALGMVVVNIALDLVLIPRYGVVGAAVASAVAVTLGGVAGLIEIRVLHGLWPFTLGHLRLVGVLAGAGFIVRFVSAALGHPGGAWLVALVALLACICYWGFVLTRSFDDIDRKIMRRAVDKLVTRGKPS